MVSVMHLQVTSRTESMLRITTEKKRGKTILSVEGRLAVPSVATLEQCWRELHSSSPNEKFHVKLCGVSFIDAAGKVLLKEIHREGGQLMAEGCLNQAIVHEIEEDESASTENTGKGRRKGSHIIFYIALFSLLFSAGQAEAQGTTKKSEMAANPSTEVLRLTLDQAVGLALKQNPTAQIAILQAAQSEQDRKIALSELLPQVQMGVTEQWERLNIRAQFGGAAIFPGVPKHLGPYPIFSAGPSFNGPIFDLRLLRGYKSSRNTANASRADSLSTREQVILLVVSQYISTLRNIADVQASQSRVDLAQALYDQAADRQKEGVSTSIDTLRANVELQNEKQRLIQAQIRAAENEKRAASASGMPSLNFNGNWAELGTYPYGSIPTYSYAGTVSVPLFTGGRIRAQIVRADLDIQRLHQQQMDLRNEIALDVKTALINLDSARSEVGVANLGVQLSKEEVDQARDRFNAGVADNIEVIQAQDSLARE